MFDKDVVARIQNFAKYHKHEWAWAGEFSTFYEAEMGKLPRAKEECTGEEWQMEEANALYNALEALETARKEKAHPYLPAGIGVWDAFSHDSADWLDGAWTIEQVFGYSHATGTGRLRLEVDQSGTFLLSVWRPGKVMPYPVLAVKGMAWYEDGPTFRWGEIEVYGEAEPRHWGAIFSAMEAISYGVNEFGQINAHS